MVRVVILENLDFSDLYFKGNTNLNSLYKKTIRDFIRLKPFKIVECEIEYVCVCVSLPLSFCFSVMNTEKKIKMNKK